MTRPSFKLLAALLASLFMLAHAQGGYEDAKGRFSVPAPTGWQDQSTPEYARFTHAEPEGVIYVLAREGEVETVALEAIQSLIDPGLDASFLQSPLQATPVPLPSGTWTQRIYQRPDDELLAVLSLEREGTTYLLFAKGTQAAFMQAINAPVNRMLTGFEIPEEEVVEELPYLAEEVTFESNGIVLAGTLTVPDAEGPHPAMILISGSGPQDRDGSHPALGGYQPFAWLADHLTREGVAVLRFDERGIGESGGDHETATSADFADDNEAALHYLLARDEINPEGIGFLGHSEGAMIAAMVAARDPNVAFVVSMAGAAVPGHDVLLVQLERIVVASGASEEEVAEAVAQQRQLLDLTRAQDWDALEAFIYELLLEQLQELPEEAAIDDLEEVARERTALQLEAVQSPWFQFFLTYDPSEDWRRITVPVLALFGELDVQVDVEQNRPALEAALAGNEDVTVVVFPTANHLFQDAVTGGPDEYFALEMEFVAGFLETISGWLLERTEVVAGP